MKRLIALTIVLIFCFIFVSCGGGNSITSSASAPVSVSTQTPSVPAEPIPLSELSFGDVTEEEFGRMCLPIFKEMYLEIFGIDVENPPYGEFYATIGNHDDINDLTVSLSGGFYQAALGFWTTIPYMSEKNIEEMDNEARSRITELPFSMSTPFESQYYEYDGEPVRETGIPYSKYPAVHVDFTLLENIEDKTSLGHMEGVPYTTEFVSENIFIFISTDEQDALLTIENYMQSVL